MNRDTLRQVLVIIADFATIIFNIAANASASQWFEHRRIIRSIQYFLRSCWVCILNMGLDIPWPDCLRDLPGAARST